MGTKLEHYKEDLLTELRKKNIRSKKTMREFEVKAEKNIKEGLTDSENAQYNWHKKRIAITINLILKLEHYEYT